MGVVAPPVKPAQVVWPVGADAQPLSWAGVGSCLGVVLVDDAAGDFVVASHGWVVVSADGVAVVGADVVESDAVTTCLVAVESAVGDDEDAEEWDVAGESGPEAVVGAADVAAAGDVE
jgi:hypothetical protein